MNNIYINYRKKNNRTDMLRNQFVEISSLLDGVRGRQAWDPVHQHLRQSLNNTANIITRGGYRGEIAKNFARLLR